MNTDFQQQFLAGHLGDPYGMHLMLQVQGKRGQNLTVRIVTLW